MAQTIEVELKAKTNKATKEIESLQKEVKKLNKQVEEGNKATADGLKAVEKSSANVAQGVKKLGSAMKAGVVFLYVEAFAKLKEVFSENQKVADFFSVTFETLSIAFNDLFNFLDRNVGTVTGYFKSIFDDPVQSIKNLGTAFKNNIIERFNSAIDTLEQ